MDRWEKIKRKSHQGLGELIRKESPSTESEKYVFSPAANPTDIHACTLSWRRVVSVP